MTQGMATTAALQISQLFIARSWRALFVVMLVSLHLAAMWGTEDYWARGLMLAHFGLFILWQPFMRSEHRLTSAQVAAIAAIALGTLYFLNWWLLALWVSVLAGIVGGKVFLFQARLLRLPFPWTPRPDLTGFSVFFPRFLLWMGLPSGRWLFFLAELWQLETKPERFMKEAGVGLARLPGCPAASGTRRVSRAISARS